MSDITTSATQVDLLRAAREMADPSAPDAGSPAQLLTLLERLLDCEAEVLDTEALLPLPRIATPAATGPTELVVDAAAGGVVHGGIRLRRPPARPFGEDDVVLVDLLRPHLSAWLSRGGDPSDRPGRPALTQRQREILALVRCGLCNKEIAHALGLTQATVRKHLENAFLRLSVASRTAAVAKAFGPDDGTESGHV